MLVNEYGELANETTLQAIKAVTDNLYTAVTALNVLLTSIDVNIVKADTNDVIISNFPASQAVTGPLTDTQLRAAAVTVSAASLPLPTGAALETTLSALKTVADGIDAVLDSIDSKITTCNTDSVTVSNFPATQPVTGPLTDSELRTSDVKVSLDGEQVAVSNFPASQAVTGPLTDSQLRAESIVVSSSSIETLSQEIVHMLRMIKTQINNLPFYDRTINRARVSALVESGTVTTCGTVTNMTNVGSFPWDVMVRMQNRSAWANTCANRIS